MIQLTVIGQPKPSSPVLNSASYSFFQGSLGMEIAVYVVGVAVTALCAILLMTAYGRNGQRPLFWSGLCFAFLTINNLLLMDDLLVWPDINLYPLRLAASTVGMLLVLYGLVSQRD